MSNESSSREEHGSVTPSVVCFPSSDPGFREHVNDVLAKLTQGSEPVTARLLAQEVAREYPECTVHTKDGLASFRREVVFYVYRDRAGVGPAPLPAQETA